MKRCRLLRFVLVLLFAFVFSGCGDPRPWRVRRGITYGPAPENVLDLYRPVNREHGLAPVIVTIHGGAWSGGSRSWGAQVADVYCRRGYLVAAVDYRLAPTHRWPAQYEDVRDSVAYLRSAGPAFCVDTTRIAVFGVSAGGHLAAMVALRGEVPVRAAVNACGEGDLRVYGTEPIMANEDKILGDVLGPAPWTPAQLADISPTTFVRRDTSMLVIHAAGDSNVFVAQSDRLTQALLLAGADTHYLRTGSGEHGDVWWKGPADDVMSGYLRARLDPERPNWSLEREMFDVRKLADESGLFE